MMIALLDIRLARTMENKTFKVTQAEGEKPCIQKAGENKPAFIMID